MIRLLFSDLDGTLWQEVSYGQHSMHEEDILAIRGLVSRDIRFAIATGRGKNSIDEVRDRIGLDALDGVTLNGACLWCDDILTKTWAIDGPELREVIYTIEGQWPCFFHLATDRGPIVVKVGDPSSDVLIWPTDKMYDSSYLLEPDLHIYKVTILCNQSYDTDVLQRAIAHPGMRSLVDQLGHIEIVKDGISKGTAIRAYRELMGYEEDEVAFIGDEINDIEAMEVAHLSFAMSTSKDVVKARADYVVDDVSEAIRIVLGGYHDQ